MIAETDQDNFFRNEKKNEIESETFLLPGAPKGILVGLVSQSNESVTAT
jgi:hypothetical protein